MKVDCQRVGILPRQRIRSGAMWLPIIVIVAGGASAIAFSIHFAKDHLRRTELRTATEAAANAAAATLKNTGDRQGAIVRAKEIAAANQVAGKPLALKNEQVRFLTRPATDGHSNQVVVAIQIRCEAQPQGISSWLTRGFHRPCYDLDAEAIVAFDAIPLRGELKLGEQADDEE